MKTLLKDIFLCFFFVVVLVGFLSLKKRTENISETDTLQDFQVQKVTDKSAEGILK
jgi:hypothetical protein